MTTKSDERFQNGAQAYAAYLETPEGRLRADLAFANLQDFLPAPRANTPMYALDIGSGTGASAVRLARLGFRVTLLDASEAMLEIANGAAEEAGVEDSITLRHGDVNEVTDSVGTDGFDVVVCHNILEYVEDPARILRSVARALRNTSAVVSILVRNQAGEVLKAAIQAGDLAAAEANLTAEWGFERLYGGKVRFFTSAGLREILNSESLAVAAERGVRVVADYLPPRISRNSDYGEILEFERKLGSRQEYAAVARYIQILARRTESETPSRGGSVLEGLEENRA